MLDFAQTVTEVTLKVTATMPVRVVDCILTTVTVIVTFTVTTVTTQGKMAYLNSINELAMLSNQKTRLEVETWTNTVNITVTVNTFTVATVAVQAKTSISYISVPTRPDILNHHKAQSEVQLQSTTVTVTIVNAQSTRHISYIHTSQVRSLLSLSVQKPAYL